MMKRVMLLGLALVAGCEKKKVAGGNDCDVVTKDPAHAMAEISKKYPNDPVKVASTIENCVAPTGDECDRVAAMLKAIPAMTPGTSAPRSADEYAKTCRESPAEMRKCFLASYALAHDAECKKVMMDIATAAQSMTAVQPDKPACDGGRIAMMVTNEGVWIATGMDKTGRCFKPNKGGALDAAGIELELAQFKSKDCKPSVELAAEDDVKYQDIIGTMDVAVKVGLVDVGLSNASELPVTFHGAEPATAAEHCPATTLQSATGGGSTGTTVAGHQTSISSTNATAPSALNTAVVIIVTRDALSLSGGNTGAGSGATAVSFTSKELIKISAAAKGSGVIAEVAKYLPKAASADQPFVIQADASTPAVVITRVIETAKAAGYENVLFAVKNK